MQPALARPEEFLPVAAKLLDNHEKLVAAYRTAREIVAAHPGTDGARVLAEMLDVGGEQKALAPGFRPALKKEVAALRRKFRPAG